MDIPAVKNALGSLDKVLTNAKQALRDVEREAYGGSAFDDFGGFEYPRQAMVGFLEELHDIALGGFGGSGHA